MQARSGPLLRRLVPAQGSFKVTAPIHLDRACPGTTLPRRPLRERYDLIGLPPQERSLLRHRDRVRVGHAAGAAIARPARVGEIEQPHYLIVKHGLAIFDAAGLERASDVMSTVLFNRELRLLDLPDARWSRYRGAGGMVYPHPITVPEQAVLLRRKPNKIASFSHWPKGKRLPGMSSTKVYRRGDLEAALRRHEAAQERAAPRLRLINPTSD